MTNHEPRDTRSLFSPHIIMELRRRRRLTAYSPAASLTRRSRTPFHLSKPLYHRSENG